MGDSMDLGDDLKATIRTVPDFPIDGIQFRDITPVLSDPVLMGKVIDSFEEHAREHAPTCVAGPEARGFIFGPLLAMRLTNKTPCQVVFEAGTAVHQPFADVR